MTNEWDGLEGLRFYMITCKINGSFYKEQGYIATELGQETIQERLESSEMIEEYEVEEVEPDDVMFPIVLIEINNKYKDWDELKRDWMILKLAGVDE